MIHKRSAALEHISTKKQRFGNIYSIYDACITVILFSTSVKAKKFYNYRYYGEYFPGKRSNSKLQISFSQRLTDK